MHMSTTRVAVAGASGYAGGEVLRLLLAHPDVEIGTLTAGSNAGERLGALQPHLVPLADRVLEETTTETLAGHDVVFLALPHGQSGPVAEQLGDDTVVIDCGADFRLTDAEDWEKFYGSAHAGSWPYGLPELPGQRARLEGARRIAVPGCYPTVSTLTLAPAVAAGLVRGRRPRRGGRVRHQRCRQGAQAQPARQRGDGLGLGVRRRRDAPPHPRDRAEPLRPHRRAGARSASRPCSCRCRAASSPPPAPRCTTGVTADDLRAAYEKAYADEPFVFLLPEGQWPATKSVTGSNSVHLQVALDEAAGRMVAVGAVDNLAKGTGGAAVQCMNLALGLPEQTGLSTVGLAP